MGIYLVHGLTRSYFTRKVTGYLDYTDRAWRLEPGLMEHAEAQAAGWNGGIPVVMSPAGDPLWDSTAVIEHLDAATDASRRVIPAHPTLAFLAYLLDDFSDEWFYRPAVGSRWSYEANTVAAGWQIAEELATANGYPAATVREMVVGVMKGSLLKLGVTVDNIDAWMTEVVVAWFQKLNAHFAETGYLFGERPSIADFAVFGANEAHFVGDPYCRDLADEHGPEVVKHTTRLLMPQKHEFGPWVDTAAIPDTLIAVLAEAGRHYLPWVAEAAETGSAQVEFAAGATANIEATPFLRQARGIMLARYVAARSPELDAILDRAGLLRFFADYTHQATSVPDPAELAQPLDNRPYAVS